MYNFAVAPYAGAWIEIERLCEVGRLLGGWIKSQKENK